MVNSEDQFNDDDDYMLSQSLLLEQKQVLNRNREIQSSLNAINKKIREKEQRERDIEKKLLEERLRVFQNEDEAHKLYQDLTNIAKEQHEIAVR